ncbi:MAG: stage III sporulation protein AF [Bacillota bacterium]|nr:stage III sporulation protein AF [Bacillota bacterium]
MDGLVQALTSWVQQVVMASLLALVVDLALPRGRFRRYGRLVLGLLLLAVLMKPVLALAGSGPQGLSRLLQQAAGEALTAASHPGALPSGPAASDQARRLVRLTGQEVLTLYLGRLEEVAASAARSVPGVADARVRLRAVSDPASPSFGQLESARVVVLPAGRTSRSGQGGPPAAAGRWGGGASAVRVQPVAPVRVPTIRVGSSPAPAPSPGEGTPAGPARPPSGAAEQRLAAAVRQAVARALGLAPERVEVAMAAGREEADAAP